MKRGQRFSRTAMYLGSILLVSLTAACGGGGGKDAILGMDTGAAAPIVPIVPGNQPIPDTTRPTVTQTVPGDGAQNAATNTRISATFSEDMDPASINGATFQLTGPDATVVAGNVSYASNSRTALFAPSTPNVLPAGTTFTGTISGARDLAGNSLAAAYVWRFATGATSDSTPPTVVSSNPADGESGLCSNQQVNVAFSEAMDPSTIDASSLIVQRSGPPLQPALPGVVRYDAAARIASFAAAPALGAGSFTVTVTTAVRDLAGNPLAANRVSTFTSVAAPCPTAPPLGAAASFGAFGGNATITNDGLLTVVHGNLGVNAASTKVTGLRDAGGRVYTTTTDNNGLVDGVIYTLTAPPGSVAGAEVTKARSDTLAAFNSISPANLPNGKEVSDLGQCASCGGAGGGADELAGRTLPPGVYRSATGTYDIGGAGRTGGDLTLDARGDANAVWIFQTAAGSGTLNVGLTGPATPAVPVKVLLINGAQAKNVFWYAPAGAVIGTGATMTGTILADAVITVSTTGGSPPTAVPTTINGRLLSLTAGVTMTNTIINTPAQ
jgi:methionine-rich copper-binding protein CopC